MHDRVASAAAVADRLPPAVARTIEVVRATDPGRAAALEESVPRVMAALLRSPFDDDAWSSSRLTDGGFPFELTLSTAGDDVRFTAEVAHPGHDPHRRLGQAGALLDAWGAPGGEVLATLGRLQSGAPLLFGTWIGVRHGRHATDYKLYVEVPEPARPRGMAWAEGMLERPVRVPGRPPALQLVGYSPSTGGFELYFRIVELHPWELVAVMNPVGLGRRAGDVLECFELAHGRALHQSLPGPVFGFSYSVRPGEPTAAAFSLYSFSETAFGVDAVTRRKLLRLSRRLSVDIPHYERLSEPLADHAGRCTHHGLFGITVSGDRAPVASIGLRPPAEAGPRHG